MDLFIDLGAPCLVYGETAGTIQILKCALKLKENFK